MKAPELTALQQEHFDDWFAQISALDTRRAPALQDAREALAWGFCAGWNRCVQELSGIVAKLDEGDATPPIVEEATERDEQ